MEAISDFIKKNDVEFTANRVSQEDLAAAQKELGLGFGRQLTDYLLHYGYLMFKSIELYGINSRQGLRSDMLTQTLYLHQYFPSTRALIALENQGDGAYYLVNSQDTVFELISEQGDEVKNTGLKLFEYILNRFEEEV
jgi:hypothetical protein